MKYIYQMHFGVLYQQNYIWIRYKTLHNNIILNEQDNDNLNKEFKSYYLILTILYYLLKGEKNIHFFFKWFNIIFIFNKLDLYFNYKFTYMK